ncbi:MAG TPA: division/cell wall cluster transcriptional repressor MraZ [Deltaproteobacteria bacterium]|nr:division/cell wall cluster transcriptional repressor MraZ [Deltaproteobacteria bacterium]
MFRGRYEHTIDSKGRVSIPSKFREILAELGESKLVITQLDGALIAYPYKEWTILEERMAGLSEFKSDTRRFLRDFYSSAFDCTIDKLGRILVPQSLRSYARLDKDVMIIGIFRQFEIWSKELWEEREKNKSQEEICDMLDRLSF